jgi:hypothetical protein
MIFGADMLKLVQQGRKTQTRRPVKYSDRGKSLDCRYQPGRSYAIQKERGGRAIDRLTVTEVRLERLVEMTLQDARREGFRTRRDFFDYWVGLYGQIEEDQQVWVITFVKGDHTDELRLLRASAPQAPVCKAPVRYADGKVRACNRAFQDNQDVCKCGARRPPEGEEDHGYTTRRAAAMKGEPEAVSAKMQEQFAREGRERHERTLANHRRRALAAISVVQEHATTGRERKRLRAAANQIKALDNEAKGAA